MAFVDLFLWYNARDILLFGYQISARAKITDQLIFIVVGFVYKKILYICVF